MLRAMTDTKKTQGNQILVGDCVALMRDMAEASVDIVPVAPRLLFYEEHPLYGILPKALIGSFFMWGDETHIGVFPFYFETDARASAQISYGWEVNYQPVSNERGPSITLRRATYAGGKSNLFLEAKSADEEKLFQAAEERLTIEFPAKAPSFVGEE